jgi:KDO2-lipid IV(A) lauroyltransferase
MRRIGRLLADAALACAQKAVDATYRLFGMRLICLAGRLAGDVIYLADGARRRATAAELSALLRGRYGEGEIRGITRRSFENHYMRIFETAFFGSLDRARLDRVIRAEGVKNLDDALSRGRGVILLLSHFGSFLLPLPYLGYRGYRVYQITGRRIRGSRLADRIWAWRKKQADRLPVGFIQAGRFMRPLYEALKGNAIVAVAFDGRDGTRWAEADFLGRKALFSTGPFELAQRTGAAILPVFTVRDGAASHRLMIYPPFDVTRGEGSEAASADAAGFAAIFADHVARYPCHFGMVLYKLRMERLSGAGVPFFAECR